LRDTPSYRELCETGDNLNISTTVASLSVHGFDAEHLHWALGRLSLPHREVLILHFLEDFSLAEIAEIAGVPEGTVKSRLHYAKEALRSVLQKEAEDYE
ncbi:sigma factor-like helix-turn-helix DNA-binding protein, partial [Candidatus Neomarinimicrobiota bacterium]